jgi:lipopolysaccharide export system protein LptA
MSARDASLVKFARRGIAVLLIVLLGAAAYHFVVRRQRPVRPVTEKAAPDVGQIDRKEGIEHREYKNGRVWADVRADRFFLGQDGLDHLEGSVEIVDYGRTEGRETRISADRVAYDKDMVHFTISGRVRVRDGDLTFESESVTYDKDLGLYRTDRGGNFSSDRLAGSGRVFEYREERNELHLSGGFRLEIKPSPPSSTPAELAGDSLVYRRDGKKGSVEGRARLASGELEGTSALLRFELEEDEGRLRTATFEKDARCVFAGGRDRPGNRAVEAKIIRLLPAAGSSSLAGVEAEGDCRLALDVPSEPRGQVRSGKARLSFRPDGKLDSWAVSDGVTMTLEEKPGLTYEFSGGSISYSDQDGKLTVLAKEGEAARLESAESRIEAPVIALAVGPKDVEASGGVRCFLKPRPDSTPLGFFSSRTPLFVTCRSLRSAGESRRFHFEGDARAWQDDGLVRAGELDFAEASGEVSGRGGVTAAFPKPSRVGSGAQRIDAGGDDMTFSPAERTVSFRGAGFVRIPGARLTAGTVAVSLIEEQREVRRLHAWGGVAVFKGNYEGRGEDGQYDPQAETLILTGSPVLVEKGKGATRGDKLTFHLGDDKILIENKGQGRSITVVKS